MNITKENLLADRAIIEKNILTLQGSLNYISGLINFLDKPDISSADGISLDELKNNLNADSIEVVGENAKTND